MFERGAATFVLKPLRRSATQDAAKKLPPRVNSGLWSIGSTGGTGNLPQQGTCHALCPLRHVG